MTESDWKIFSRELYPSALTRYSQKTLDDLAALSANNEKDPYERFLDISELIRTRNKELKQIFTSLSRSSAFSGLLQIYSRNLITEEGFLKLSEETRARIIQSTGA
jgi:hypothetical protein